tara:strand:- start:59 stop:697 length:639 start_codon:yes stop_codon:yes gene_type:complete
MLVFIKMDYKYKFKIATVGDTGVGKTSLLNVKIDKNYLSTHIPTIGVEYRTFIEKANSGEKVKFQIWDTSGEENFRSITKSYYRDTIASIIVFSFDNKESFKNVDYWVDEVRKHSNSIHHSIILVGNKCDLKYDGISSSTVIEYADEKGLTYIETSCKNGINIDKFFKIVAKIILDKIPYMHDINKEPGIILNDYRKPPRAREYGYNCCTTH